MDKKNKIRGINRIDPPFKKTHRQSIRDVKRKQSKLLSLYLYIIRDEKKKKKTTETKLNRTKQLVFNF